MRVLRNFNCCGMIGAGLCIPGEVPEDIIKAAHAQLLQEDRSRSLYSRRSSRGGFY